MCADPLCLQTLLVLAGPQLFPEDLGQFALRFDYRRAIEPWQAAAFDMPEDAVEIGIRLSIPAAAAEAWLRAPGERHPDYFSVYSQVALAVQRALRKWLPLVWFTDIRRYERTARAHALIFYQTTRARASRPRDFGHELVAPDRAGLAGPWAAPQLANALAKVEPALRAAGRDDLARLYAPKLAPAILRRIVRDPRLINRLLSSEQFVIDRLVRLGLDMPTLDSRALLSYCRRFSRAVRRRLWRPYGGDVLAPLLLLEATRVLAGGPPAACPCSEFAMLRV